MLFILFINDTHRCDRNVSNKSRLALFTDDKAAYFSSTSEKLAVGILTEYVKLLLDYFNK